MQRTSTSICTIVLTTADGMRNHAHVNKENPMTPMSQQNWNAGEKYLAIRVLFIYVLMMLLYLFPFFGPNPHALHTIKQKMVHGKNTTPQLKVR